jgi:hypothetical protein
VREAAEQAAALFCTHFERAGEGLRDVSTLDEGELGEVLGGAER